MPLKRARSSDLPVARIPEAGPTAYTLFYVGDRPPRHRPRRSWLVRGNVRCSCVKFRPILSRAALGYMVYDRTDTGLCDFLHLFT